MSTDVPGGAGVITDVPGVRVGHWSDHDGITGCTVILLPDGTVGTADVRGGAPGTLGTASMRPGTLVHGIDAVVLTGGSAFGLASVDGVMRNLEERGIGLEAGPARVPIVAGAVLFDLGVGDAAARPGPADGYAACDVAKDGPMEEGSVGAGTGATVAKIPDPRAGMKGGIGTAALRDGDLIVGAVAAVNSLGRIVDEDGSTIAGSRNPAAEPEPWRLANTTLVCVATNARVGKEGTLRLSYAAHDGIALAVRPAHTHWDGDVAFALATGDVEPVWASLPEMVGTAVAAAIRRGVREATGVPGYPAVGEMA